MQMIIKTSKKKEIVDITDVIDELLESKGVRQGLCTIFVKHTTAAITTADLDPGTDLDMLDAFDSIVPNLNYRHPHNPSHVGDHIMATLIGPSVSLHVLGGHLQLGVWQRVILVELDGPRARELVISLVKIEE